MGGIYRITNTVNGKFYIGSAKDFKDRWQRHRYALKAGSHENKHLQRSWDKYGKEAFLFEVVEEVLSDDQLLDREQDWLDTTKVVEIGFNMLSEAGGGRRGIPHSEETKQKISEKAKGHTRNVGRKHPPEYGQAITLRQLGSRPSDETRLKMSISAKLRCLRKKQKEEDGRQLV